MGVDHQAPAHGVRPLTQPQPQPQSGILGGEEGAQVLIEREDQLHLACRGEGDKVKSTETLRLYFRLLYSV